MLTDSPTQENKDLVKARNLVKHFPVKGGCLGAPLTGFRRSTGQVSPFEKGKH
jgi:hypothetical protein